ncbi:MAG TPA: DNA-binding protein WhiA [Candidatus Bariatricus faecipullorum]|nr:DNA-binding protein WhiA [Candidatus Bariatricus faecipullorum]
MSFSGRVKEELSRQYSPARHCRIAELAAIISMCGNVCISSREKYTLKIRTENLAVARKCFTLLKKTFNIETDIAVRRNRARGSETYYIIIRSHEDTLRVLQAVKLIDCHGEVVEELSLVRNVVIQENCCKRAFLRGAFLASGSMSDPEKSYHFEIVCTAEGKAVQLQNLIQAFGLEAKVVLRKKTWVVYLKEGGQIVDILNIMEAHVALMELENIRILKDMRNTVNRKVNCETANINKTVSAAVKQIEDIRFLQATTGLEKLPDGLKDMALTRLEYPDATLKELGELLTPPVGKSGVNHRLRKLGEMADAVRAKQGGTI